MSGDGLPLSRAEQRELDALEKRYQQSRSAVSRRTLSRQLKVLKARIASDKYEREEVTLMWAANFAGSTFSDMAKAAAARGIPCFRYSVEELEQDTKTGARWLR